VSIVVLVRIWLVRTGFAFGSLLPLRRRVLLATSHADRIGGNLAFIHAELRRQLPTVPVDVMTHRIAGGLRGRLAGAIHAVRAGYALARTRVVVVDDYFFPIYVVRPRADTTIVQTWHASGAFKKFGHSLARHTFGADQSLTSRVRIHANYDLCLVGSPSSAVHYAEAFGLPLDRFVSRLGIPRTDLFFDSQAIERAKETIHARYGVPDGRRVILYAPTFRGDRITEARQPDLLDLGLLARQLEADHVLLVRLHPFVRYRVPPAAELAGFVVDASDHPDINELMLVSDVLVTDYSSAIFEFALLDRPMAFFAPDLEAYERERGFYFDYRSGVPGPVFEETGQLARWIREADYDLDPVRRFRARSFEVADGRASWRFVREIVAPALRRPTA